MSVINVATVEHLIKILESGQVTTAYMPVMLGKNLLKVAIDRRELIEELKLNQSSIYHEPRIHAQFELSNGDLIFME